MWFYLSSLVRKTHTDEANYFLYLKKLIIDERSSSQGLLKDLSSHVTIIGVIFFTNIYGPYMFVNCLSQAYKKHISTSASSEIIRKPVVSW